MKTSNKLHASFPITLAIGVLFIAGILAAVLVDRNSAPTPAIMVDNTVHTVIISAKRLSAEEKLTAAAPDAEPNVQTVVLTAKRLSTAEKLASLHEERQQKLLATHLLSLVSTGRVKIATQSS
ncbi:MAG: hypothetical protein V4488_05370 [Pseudomonadota bacterium]